MGTKTPAFSIRITIEYRVKEARYLNSIMKNFCVPNPDILRAQPLWILPRKLLGSLFSLEVTRPHNNNEIQYHFHYVQMGRNTQRVISVPTPVETRITLELDVMIIENYVMNRVENFMKPLSKHKDTTFLLEHMIPKDFMEQDFFIDFVSHGVDARTGAILYKVFGKRKYILTNTEGVIITKGTNE